jgi:hypothetical protein
MKKYEQFITNKTIGDYLFVLTITDKNSNIIEPLIKYLNKYIELSRTEESEIYNHENAGILFKIYYKKTGNINAYFIKGISVSFFNSDYENVKNRIDLEDFMNVGFEGVENFITLHQNVNNYNL